MSSALRVLVQGRVQGVAFRWSAAERARALGVRGWVRNLADGRVEAHVEGDREATEAMLEWLASGPALARVDEIRSRPVPAEDATSFEVLR